MKSIKIKSLKEGMVTAADVKDRMGRTILTVGQTVTAQNLKTLKTWGIVDISIEDSTMPKSDSQQEEVIDVVASPAIIKEQETLFKYSDRRHPVIVELYKVCLARKVQLQLED